VTVKRILVLWIVMMMAVPAISYAGSATSRWDLSIGGMVQVDLSYASQSVNQEAQVAERSSGIATSSRDKYSSTSWGAGQSRINFGVKGPETWGAKTSAFVEFNFAYMSNNAVAANVRNSTEDYGLAALTQAFMKWEWPTFSLLMGQTWNPVISVPTYYLPTTYLPGILQPQIAASWQATKTFSVTGGIMAPYNTYGWPGGTLSSGQTIDDGFQRSNWPLLFTELAYTTDWLGKIGPSMLQFGLGAIYGQEKPIAPANLGPVGNINAQNSSNTVSNPNIAGVQYSSPVGYTSSNVNAWMVTGKAFIPIIPEKSPGRLGGSLALSLYGFTGQDVRLFLNSTQAILGAYSYNRNDPAASGNVLSANYTAPVTSGGWAQVAFYLTDTIWTTFYYGQTQTDLSQWRRNQIDPSAIDRNQQYMVNLIYDPNPAIRIGIEYSYYTTHYARNTSAFDPANPSSVTANGLKSDGTLSVIRFAAQYFF
jgi:hypothetical protein